MTLRTRLHATSFLVASLIPVTAFAAVPVTPAAEPARIQKNLGGEIQRPDVGGATIITVPDDKGKEKATKSKASFTLKSVVIENATVFTPEQLQAEYADKVGQKISLKDLYDIAGRITAKYRNAGYILSRAVVPPQRISGGNVKLKIVEGFVDRVVIEGKNADSSLLQAYGEKIRNAKPLSTDVLERYLLLIQDLPGVTARAVLRPSPTVAGASDVVITVSEKKFDATASVDNRGTRYIGPYQGGVTVDANNLLGIYDRTQIRGTLTANPSELQFFQISHDEQLDTEGTKLTLAASHTRTQPNFRLKPFDIQGTDTLVSAAVSHPFLRSRQTKPVWQRAV